MSSFEKRVVVTGIGAICGLGCNMDTIFSNIIQSKSGIGKITRFDTTNYETKIAGEVKLASNDEQKADENNFFNPLSVIDFKDQKKMDLFMMYAIKATDEALKQANWLPKDEYSLQRTGVVIGSGIGGLSVIQDQTLDAEKKGINKISPFFVPKALINLASGWVSMKYGFMGPNHSVVTACATGAHAIYDAAIMIKAGMADVVVCGGAESTICSMGIGGFNAAKALSTKYNDSPEKASRPWDEGRDGFVMGEGAGILVLESYEHAQKRGAKILCEYISAGMSGDAYHITSPSPDGRGAKLAMKMALSQGKVNASDIDYINAHGTSTPVGDGIELAGVAEVLGASEQNKKFMSSTKSSTGHLLGAAGSLEAAICVKAACESILPPTLNLENPCQGTEAFDLVAHKAKQFSPKYILSNSFGFGGTNISLIFKKFN